MSKNKEDVNNDLNKYEDEEIKCINEKLDLMMEAIYKAYKSERYLAV